MLRVRVAVLALLVVGGCDGGMSDEEKSLQEERDIAMVKEANEQRPPLEQITPEPLLYPDIERYDLYGEACAYAAGTSLGTRVFAREADAFMKIGGEVQRFAADPGARQLPMRTRSLYNGRNFALKLQIEGKGEGPTSPEGQADTAEGPPPGGPGGFEGTVTVFDKYGRTVYDGSGPVQCKRT